MFSLLRHGEIPRNNPLTRSSLFSMTSAGTAAGHCGLLLVHVIFLQANWWTHVGVEEGIASISGTFMTCSSLCAIVRERVSRRPLNCVY